MKREQQLSHDNMDTTESSADSVAKVMKENKQLQAEHV
jgi:hypothetical protein